MREREEIVSLRFVCEPCVNVLNDVRVQTYWFATWTDRIEYKLSGRLGTFSWRMMIVWCVMWTFRFIIATRWCCCITIILTFHAMTHAHTIARCRRCCVNDCRAAWWIFSAVIFELSRFVWGTASACVRKFSGRIRSFCTWFCLIWSVNESNLQIKKRTPIINTINVIIIWL